MCLVRAGRFVRFLRFVYRARYWQGPADDRLCLRLRRTRWLSNRLRAWAGYGYGGGYGYGYYAPRPRYYFGSTVYWY